MASTPPDPVPEGTDTVAAPEPELIHGCPVTYSYGQRVVHPTRDGYLDLMRTLVDEGYLMCAELTAVDYLSYQERALPEGIEPGRFEVVVVVRKLDQPEALRVRVQLPADDPALPTLFDLWPGAEALEREVYDMFGIRFDDHPDLTRILMPEDWVGHPLRKDYSVGSIPVQFKGAPQSR